MENKRKQEEKEEPTEKKGRGKQRKEIYIIEQESEKGKPWTVYIGNKVPKQFDYHIASYPTVFFPKMNVFLDDEGYYKNYQMNTYAFDILLEIGQLLPTDKEKKEHDRWAPTLLAMPMTGPAHLVFKDKKFYDQVVEFIEGHCELACVKK